MTIPQNQTMTSFGSKKKESIIYWIQSEWKGILAEFVSTMLLIAFGCMSCIPIEGFSPNPVMYAPLTFGLVVMFNIQIFGHISGAFMNPFVSIIAALWGKITASVAIAYIVAEMAGATLGYGFLMAISPVDVAGDGLCLTLPHKGINGYQALAVEIVLTLALSLVNCAVWDPVNEQRMDSVPLKFGFTIVGLSFAGGPITGASMNPARSFAPALWANNWNYHWVYWVGPLVGGILPALFYKYTWLNRKEEKSLA